MRPWQLIATIVITATLAAGFGWHPLSIVAYVLTGALLFALLWRAIGLRGLVFRRTAPGGHAQVGERVEEELILENHSRLPKLWVQVLDSSTLPGHHAGYVTSIGPRERVTWRVKTICQRRGRYSLGPVTAISGDPLGLFKQVTVLAQTLNLLVLPKVLPLTNLALYPGGQPGRGRGSRRSPETTTNVVTVRSYVPGDPLARIHWPSTARTSQFMVKEFDLDPTVDVMMVLDLDSAVQAGKGLESTEETGVTIAASIMSYLLASKDIAVGLLVSGSGEAALPLDRGARQLDRGLEVLAMSHPEQEVPLTQALTEIEASLQRNTVLFVITPSLSHDWAGSLALLQRRGVKPAVFLLDPESFVLSQAGAAQVAEQLVESDIVVHVIRHNDDLRAALEHAGAETMEPRSGAGMEASA
ncbi:MAG TPA: DUF58 domain-containing protein [Ktedonobacterales bacterium]